MADANSTSTDADARRRKQTSKYVRWGGLAAVLGPLLVLAANGYGIWVSRTYGGGPAGMAEAATTAPYVAFGGVRLLGGTLLVFGLVALYARQAEAAGTLGLVGFVGSMVGTVLLTAVAWFQAFAAPVMAEGVPDFLVAVRTGEAGLLLGAGVQVPIFLQAIGWTVFGIATYRAEVFPRRATVVLIVGALLLFVPVQGIPVVFQVAVAWLGFLLFSGRVGRPNPGERASVSRSGSAGN